MDPRNVVPALIRMIKSESGRLPPNAYVLDPNSVLSNYYGIGYYALGTNKGEGDRVEIAAIQGLSAFPAAAAETVPELVRVIRDEKDPRVRWFTAAAIAKLGPKAKDAVPALIDALRSKDVATGGPVVVGMGSITEEDGPVRLAAAVALGKIGREARFAVPALLKALDDPDSRVRAEAAASLGAIGPDAAAAIPELARLAAGEGDDPVADLATRAMGEMKAVAVPALTQLLHLGLHATRVRVMSALGESAQASVAIPELVRALVDDDEEIRTAAVEALGKIGIGPEATVAIPRLIDSLKDPDRHVASSPPRGWARSDRNRNRWSRL